MSGKALEALTGPKTVRQIRLPFFYGWLLVGVSFVTMAIGVNARTAYSLLFPQILDEFGWDRGITAGAFSFGFLISAVVTPCVGWLQKSTRRTEIALPRHGAAIRRHSLLSPDPSLTGVVQTTDQLHIRDQLPGHRGRLRPEPAPISSTKPRAARSHCNDG